MVTKILSILLCFISLNVWADKELDSEDRFRAPTVIDMKSVRWVLKKFPNYRWKQWDTSASFINYFDSSITILSSSGDTKDITLAKKGDRIFFYDHYELIGSEYGYTETETLSALTELQPENRYWRDVGKYSAITVGTSATLFTLFESLTAPVASVLNKAMFYGDSALYAPAETFLTVAGLTAAVAIPIILVYNKYSGKPTVHKNVMTSYNQLISEGKTHIAISRSESYFYSELLHKAARSINYTRNSTCAGFF